MPHPFPILALSMSGAMFRVNYHVLSLQYHKALKDSSKFSLYSHQLLPQHGPSIIAISTPLHEGEERCRHYSDTEYSIIIASFPSNTPPG